MFSFANAQPLVVFDLEWNQNSYASNMRMPHEIIEIGACRIEGGQVVSTFSALIKPHVYRRLDRHIKQVTGITEAELATGRSFQDVFGDFIHWCGDAATLVTWGRDDYPVLRRNTAFFGTPMPFSPPVDAQFVFGFAQLQNLRQQMNLHAALEMMNLTPDVPAHRAVYDAQCTALLLPLIDEAVGRLTEEKHAELLQLLDKERRVADSMLRSLQTRYAYQTEALADRSLMDYPCPLCGAKTRFVTPWFDSGREKYLSVARCRQHGLMYGQMHFKRAQSGLLLMHQRAFSASAEDAADVAERYRLYQLTPPRKRHHRLNMEEASQKSAPAGAEKKP